MADFWQDAARTMHSVQFWLGVVVGAMLGAVLSVTADRLWQRFERRTKVRISVGSYTNVNGQDGFSMKITNIGRRPIPPCRPWLVGSQGRYSFYFRETKDGDLPYEWGVGQTEVFLGPVFLHGKPTEIPQQIANYAEQNVEFTFQLVLEKSEIALYQNKRMGQAFVRAIQKSHKTDPAQAPVTRMDWDWGDSMDMMTIHGIRGRIKRLWHRVSWWWFVNYGKGRKK